MSIEAMKLALEALEDANYYLKYKRVPEESHTKALNAITALRQAIENHKEWVSLTDKELSDIYLHLLFEDDTKDHTLNICQVYSVIEAKLKEKNNA
jgi:hypothetical protein